MNLKTAFQYQNKLSKLINETMVCFRPDYYIEKTKKCVKSELNNLVENGKFEDEIINESDPKFGQYDIGTLLKCLNLLWTERCQLATGISLSKNMLTLSGAEELYSYDAMLMYNNDRRRFLDAISIDSYNVSNKPYREKEFITYMGNAMSYPAYTEYKIDEKQVNLLSETKKSILYGTDTLSSELEGALYKIEVDDVYKPVIPFSITFEDLYNNIDLVLEEKNKKAANIASSQDPSENVIIKAEDLEKEEGIN